MDERTLVTEQLKGMQPGIEALLHDVDEVTGKETRGENWVREAVGVLTGMARVKKMLEGMRKEATGDLKERLKRLETPFREVLKELEERDRGVRDRVLREYEGTEQVRVEGAGKLEFREYWTYEVVDISQVPKDLLEVDTSAVGLQIKAGMRNIPGLRVYQDRTLVVKPEK